MQINGVCIYLTDVHLDGANSIRGVVIFSYQFERYGCLVECCRKFWLYGAYLLIQNLLLPCCSKTSTVQVSANHEHYF